MDNEGTGIETGTVESINAEIDQVRSERKPFQGSRRADSRLNDLYRQRSELDGTAGELVAGSGEAIKPDDNVIPRGRSRLTDPRPVSDALATAKDAGLDVSNIDPNEMTDARIDGLRHLAMIEKGDLQTLGPELSKAATELKMPAQTIQFLDQFTSSIAQPNDPLSNAILETIANHIFDVRSS